jgi:hypothetical protein
MIAFGQISSNQRPELRVEMKTTIYVPDDLFKKAEKFARATGSSRSELYTDAICEYLDRHGEDKITAALNRVAWRGCERTRIRIPFLNAYSLSLRVVI